ncbi:hypothetical protein BD413DRAFT_164901 [Trametes elegans]|nr:hypothetical protein BD413DRAFT_164901 [Trametes elegans]
MRARGMWALRVHTALRPLFPSVEPLIRHHGRARSLTGMNRMQTPCHGARSIGMRAETLLYCCSTEPVGSLCSLVRGHNRLWAGGEMGSAQLCYLRISRHRGSVLPADAVLQGGSQNSSHLGDTCGPTGNARTSRGRHTTRRRCQQAAQPAPWYSHKRRRRCGSSLCLSTNTAGDGVRRRRCTLFRR